MVPRGAGRARSAVRPPGSGEVSRSRPRRSVSVRLMLVAWSGAVFLLGFLCSRRPWRSGVTVQRVRCGNVGGFSLRMGVTSADRGTRLVRVRGIYLVG